MKRLYSKIMVLVFLCLVILGIGILTYKTIVSTIVGICCLGCAVAIMFVIMKDNGDNKDD